MKILGIIRETDIFPGQPPTPEEQLGKLRQTVRIVLFDKYGKIAMGCYPPSPHNEMKGSHGLPGGGVEEGESIIKALFRESSEETGCLVKNVRELGIIKEFGVGKKIKHNQDTHCFMAEVDGEKGIPKFTERETEDGLEIRWVTIEDALKFINDKNLCVEKIRELICLKEVEN
ncbi:MAG: NUDIX domain-containing protein [bacterium]